MYELIVANMESQRETSLQWGAGMGFAGFLGVIFFILNPNTPMLSFIQMFVGQQITLGFLQFMSALTIICGIALFVHGLRSSD